MSATKFLKILFLVFLFLLLLWGGYFIFRIGITGKKISIDNKKTSVIGNIKEVISSFIPKERKLLKGEEDGRINILLLGTAGKGKPGQNLTDTILILNLDAKNKKTALLSIPRDLYVNIAETSFFTKINSVYQYGLSNNEDIEPVKKTVEKITGLPIHYFIVLDFEGFKKIINDIGRITVYVEKDIYDPKYPGENYSYETFNIKKGTYLMDGEMALKYVRERYDDMEGDFGRAKRQQKIMQSTKNKIFSLKTLFNPLTLDKLLTDLGNNVKTDISLNEIESFMELAKKFDTQNIGSVVLDAWKRDSVLKVSHIFSGGARTFVLVPRVGNFSEVKDLAANIFDLDAIRRRQSEIEKESASVTILNQSDYKNLAAKVKDILESKLKINDVKIIGDPDAANDVLEKSIIYDKTNGQKIFTLDEIIKKLGFSLGNDGGGIIEKQKSDLVLLLGNDLKDIALFGEDNSEDFRKSEDNQSYFELIKN